MGRPSDWSLLGGADPCPGSIDEALGLSDSWGRCAGGLSDAHRVLSGVEVSGAGNAVIAAGDLVRSSAGLLGVYRDACEGCAHALTMWARALEMLQSEADRLHAQALQAKDDQEAGQRMIATGRDERIREATAKGLLDGMGQTMIETLLPRLAGSFSDQRGQALVAEATERLHRLRQQTEQLRDEYRAEGDRVAHGLMIPVPSDAVSKAGLATDTPIGNGAIAAILNPGKDRQLAALNNLYGKASAGDTQAQQQYLTALAALTPMQLALFAVWQQGQARNPLTQGRVDVPATKAWWGGLNPSTQALLIAAVPGIIGNLNGVPYSTRDKANMTLLNTLRRDPGVSERVREALDGIEKSVKHRDGSPRSNRFVVAFDLNNDKPLAAVAIGDLDTAGNVTWNIPGMGTTVAPGGIDNWTNGSQAVYEEQRTILRNFGSTGLTNAVVSWVGYETPGKFPESMDVFSGDLAWAGSDKLAAALDGFYETRNAGNGIGLPKVHVVAHSYGTTNAAYALTKTAYDVNTVRFVGSAGIDPNVVPNAEAMNVETASDGKPAVYATLAVRDLVAPAGIWGSQTAGVDSALGDFITNPVDALDRYFDTINNQEPIQPRVSPTSPVVGSV